MPDRIPRTGSYLSTSATPSCWSTTANPKTGKGEYAILLANGGGPKLVGIIVGTNPNSPNIDDNVAPWRKLVQAARDSNLRNIPDPIASIGDPLTRPSSGEIDDTQANHSEGANRIIEAANEFSLPYRPLVVVTGGRLTDVADAYLMDRR
jgi:hypothetical protein